MAALLAPRAILSSRYQRGWGAWEAFREVQCNALDADKEGMIVSYDPKDPDYVAVYTTTAPSLAELCILGEGSKDPGGDTIGQFGEGIKLAAATVLRMGGTFVIETAKFLAKFELRDEEGASAPVLWCVPEPNPTTTYRGCKVIMQLKGANWRQFATRFCDPNLVVLGQANGNPKIFSKGVLITTLQTAGLHHYNLNHLSINRDRNVPNHYSVLANIANFGFDAFDAAAFQTMFNSPDSAQLELDAMMQSPDGPNASTMPRIKDAFQEVFTDKGVLLTSGNSILRERVENHGLRPVEFDKRAHGLIRRAGIKNEEESLPKGYQYTTAWSPETPEHQKYSAIVRQFLKVIEGVPVDMEIRFCNEEFLGILMREPKVGEEGERPCLWLPKLAAEQSVVCLGACVLQAISSWDLPGHAGAIKYGSKLAVIGASGIAEALKIKE